MIEKHDQFLKNTFESLGEPDNNYRENKNRFFSMCIHTLMFIRKVINTQFDFS